MNIFASKRGNTAAFQLKPVAAGCAVFLTMLSAAQAQEAPAADGMQSVVVTGIRSGIEAAISIKKNSNSIVEAISAEDIGKLPDQSVAESISRLPGVTAQRSRGTGKPSDISVRGLSPSFNGSLLNGREQASTGNARSPEFDLFPAELVSGVAIYKTPDATLVGQGLASTIDMKTMKPLDFGKRVLAASGRKERTGVKNENGNPEGDGHRYSFAYVDTFANRTIGIALGVTKQKDVGGGQAKFEGGGVESVDWNGAKVKIPNGFKADTETTASDRTGVSATFEYRPTKEFRTTVDVFHSSGSNSLKKTGLEGSIAGSWGGYDPVGKLIAATVSNGVATSGTMSGFKGDVRNHMEQADDKLNSFGWKTEWKTGGWNLIADLSHSKAHKDAVRFETTAGQAGNTPEAQVGSISWTGFDGSNLAAMKLTPSWNYADRTKTFLTDHAGWGGGPNSPQAGYVAMPKVDDKVDSIRLSGKTDVEWGPIAATTYGMNFTKRDKIRAGEEGRLVVKGADGYATATVPGSDVATAGTTGIPIVSFNPIGSLGSIYNMVQWIDDSVLAKDWSVTEKVTTLYAMGDLDGEISGIPYRGNFGAQYVHTNQHTTGNKVIQSLCTGITAATCPFTKIEDGTSYNDFLPSLNLNFDIGNDQLFRVAAAKVLARANLDDMRASSSFGVKQAGGVPILTGSGGNAKLEPFRAKALDLSYEKYFGKKGYFSAAAFYKKLDTYVLRAPRNFDFKNQVTPGTVLPDSGPYKGSTVGLLTTPINGDGGNLHGYELAVNVPFSLVSEYLDGFGAMLNHSDTSSSLTLPKDGFSTKDVSPTSIPLPGLSKKVSNLRMYYEKHGFQVAWAARKRSDFLGQISDYQDNAQLTFVKGDTIIDLQASYEFQKGWLKGLSVFVTANNWNNTPYTEYNGVDKNAVTFTTTYGRTYQFGANYKF
ncbi:TonB-dependent receptor [Pseudoduganella sp. OTU4001]|uniref:TonB-dependent receptor n=1 Tax=Pseudoduganella sp. OTU4001 TaxID=3043854 RepID=UPI00313DAB98